MATLADQVAAGWEDAPDEAERAGPAVAPSLLPLASSPDEEIRSLVYACLGRCGGPVAARALLGALKDESEDALTVAVRAVRRTATADLVPELVLALDGVAPADLREQLVLTIGRLDGWDPALLRERRQREPAPAVREAELLAMARAGDPEARAELAKLLVGAPREERPRLIRRAEYVGQPWIAPLLTAYLDDWAPAKRLVEEFGPPDALRVCDLALDLVSRVTGQRFTDAPRKRTNYPLATLEEAKAFVLSLPGAHQPPAE